MSLVSLGIAGAYWGWLRPDERAREHAEALSLAGQAYGALRTGATRLACKLATDARQRDPGAREPALAWLHATGLDLLEGDGGASRAIGFIDEARRLGAKGVDIAFATLVAAVVIKNDRLARRQLDQHDAQGFSTDAFYEYAAGAALDLDCDAAAEDRFRRSAHAWADAPLPRLRRARSLAFAGRLMDARDSLEGLDAVHPPTLLMRQVLDVLATPSAKHPHIDPFAITDLPRSLRPLAQALTVSGDNAQAGIDAALSDIDSPLVALACFDIAKGAGDLASAERAAEVASEQRGELLIAFERLVQVRLSRGALARAGEAAQQSGDSELITLVAAISAYEEGKLDALKRALDDAGAAAWSLGLAAKGLLGEGQPPPLAGLESAAVAGEPWADMLVVDSAIANDKPELALKIVLGWTEDSPARKRRRDRLNATQKRQP